jgi:hypothetical protein
MQHFRLTPPEPVWIARSKLASAFSLRHSASGIRHSAFEPNLQVSDTKYIKRGDSQAESEDEDSDLSKTRYGS